MTVENDKGKTEVLTDYQSFAAGYRQAVLDCQNVRPSLLPAIVAFVLLMLIFRAVSEGM
jgi:hypothetical protein